MFSHISQNFCSPWAGQQMWGDTPVGQDMCPQVGQLIVVMMVKGLNKVKLGIAVHCSLVWSFFPFPVNLQYFIQIISREGVLSSVLIFLGLCCSLCIPSLFKIMYILCGRVGEGGICMYPWMERTAWRVCSLFPLYELQVWNSGQWAWRHEHVPTKLSCHPQFVQFYRYFLHV